MWSAAAMKAHLFIILFYFVALKTYEWNGKMRSVERLLTETQSRANGPLSGKRLLLMWVKEGREKHAECCREQRHIWERKGKVKTIWQNNHFLNIIYLQIRLAVQRVARISVDTLLSAPYFWCADELWLSMFKPRVGFSYRRHLNPSHQTMLTACGNYHGCVESLEWHLARLWFSRAQFQADDRGHRLPLWCLNAAVS